MGYLRVSSVPTPCWTVVVVFALTLARLLVGLLLRLFIVIVGGVSQDQETEVEQTSCRHTFTSIFPEMESGGSSPYPIYNFIICIVFCQR